MSGLLSTPLVDERSVAIVIPSWNGADHLPACLDSVAALDFPRDRVEVIVVDDGSTDDSRRLLADRYRWARVIEHERNEGFAAGINSGARAARADVLAFLNNDMRVGEVWLRELLSQYDPDAGWSCVAGVILDWEGEHVDFAGGSISFHGFGLQEGVGEPLEDVALVDGRELPFACGGSMLVDRRLFLELGGFDPAFFAFYEDVDFGWRARLTGSRIRLAANAQSFHRHHGTTGSLSPARQTLLYERNALRMLIKNLDEANLTRILSASLLLLVERAQFDLELGRPGKKTSSARLRAIEEIVAGLDDAMRARAEVQARRSVSDEDIFALFGDPFHPAVGVPAYAATLGTVTRAFGVDRLFPEEPPPAEAALPAHGLSPEGVVARVWRRLPPRIRRRVRPLIRRFSV